MREAAEQLAEHDLAIAQIGGEEQGERLALFFLGDGPGEVSRRQHQGGRPLHHEDGDDEFQGELVHLSRRQRRALIERAADHIDMWKAVGIREPETAEEHQRVDAAQERAPPPACQPDEIEKK